MENQYAPISTRIKALVIDTIVLIILMYSASEIFNLIENTPDYIRIIIFFALFLLYEPILISLYGATVGHFFNDIVVKQENDETKNINIVFAVARFITKSLLGWISLIIVNGNDKKKAIHDYIAKSVVLPYRKIKE
ncbi:hypothetical protein A8C32_02595 [Flavivirga aquatica]|uniref:RDD domain-containing protein n=1 Tax=Flavivirga aquatica TaxID=1849968 RepID=A0A1E5TAH9_9FLAO|nr:RDD family protein [Flavivirga aquatica]OEK08358.1 hypothetical protein A8C32_02595 [Flavivirga aquatica]